ncbi:MAG: metallophosphoesterase [Rhizobiales bacterium]|nr:metallophosphoesterase [Hyphomicrobiales bacterium]
MRMLPVVAMIASFLGAPVHAQEAGHTFLHVSDIHLDPFTSFAARKLAPYGEDTNYALFATSLAAIAKAGTSADFVVVTGDLLVHDFEKKLAVARGDAPSQPAIVDAAVSTSSLVADALAMAVPGKPVILALGNNDSDCGDYQIDPGGPYLEGTRELVKRLAGATRVADDFDATYRAGGYYAMRHPTAADTDIIVLNDVLWSAEYRDVCGSTGRAAADAMMNWFKARLDAARAANRKVWMVHHIPAGIDAFATQKSKDTVCGKKAVAFMSEPFATRFPELLAEYAPVITANLTGHVHFDGYRLILGKNKEALDVEKIAPAISPIFGQNPGFHVFDYDAKSGEPTDFTTVYLDLVKPVAGWRTEYRFTRAYRLKRFDASAVNKIWTAIAAAGPERKTYGAYYDVGSAKFTSTLTPAFYCALGESSLSSFTACLCKE